MPDMQRRKPVPLENVEDVTCGSIVAGDFSVVLKNTFLEVPREKLQSPGAMDPYVRDFLTFGLRTAPASMHQKAALEASMVFPGGSSKSDDTTGTPSCTPTTTSDVLLSPSWVNGWPATPASPGAPMTLSLATMMGEPWEGTALSTSTYYEANLDLMSGSQEAYLLADPFSMMTGAASQCVDCAPMPPPPGSPRLPAGFSWQEPGPAPSSIVAEDNRDDWAGFRWPSIAQEDWAVVPCMAGVPIPKCAPPCSPAPAPMEADTGALAPLTPCHAA